MGDERDFGGRDFDIRLGLSFRMRRGYVLYLRLPEIIPGRIRGTLLQGFLRISK
jgi:hypothetical protein